MPFIPDTPAKSNSKTQKKENGFQLKNLFNPLVPFSYPLPTEGLPRLTLPEHKNPVLNFILKDIPEDFVNQPASSIESMGKLNQSQRALFTGEKPLLTTPQEVIGEAANTALLPLTFVGGSAVSSVIKSGGKAALKTAIKQGVKTGIKTGAAYGMAQGLKQGKDKESVQSQLLEGAKGAVSGGVVGGVTGGIAPIAGNTVKRILGKSTDAIKQQTTKATADALKKQKNLWLIDWRSPEIVLRKLGLYDTVYLPLKEGQELVSREVETGYKKFDEWYKVLGKSSEAATRVFDWLDGKQVPLTDTEKKVGEEVKQYLLEWANKIGLPHEKRISNYIPHLFKEELEEGVLSDDLQRLLDYTVPSELFNPYLEKRTGALGYKRDLFTALDSYLNKSARKLYLDPPLQMSKQAGEHGTKQAQEYVTRYLRNFANKKSETEKFLERNIFDALPVSIREKLGTRPARQIANESTSVVYRATLGGNINSALRNLTQVSNTYGELGTKYTVLGYKQLIEKGVKELSEVGALDDLLLAEFKTTPLQRKLAQVDKALYFPFTTAEKINRAGTYWGAKQMALDKGMSEFEAIQFAKEMTRKLQFAHGKLDSPLVTQNPVGKVAMQYASYPVKQLELVSGWAGSKEYKKLTRYTASSLAIFLAVGDLLGLKPSDLLLKNIMPGLGPIPDTLFAGLKVGGSYLSGNEPNYRDVSELKNTPRLVIPAGTQINKSSAGIKAVNEGGVYDKRGRKQYPIETTEDKIRAIIFGPWNTRAAKEAEKETNIMPDVLKQLFNMQGQKTSGFISD